VYHSNVHAFDMLYPGEEVSKEAIRKFEERFLYAKDHYYSGKA